MPGAGYNAVCAHGCVLGFVGQRGEGQRISRELWGLEGGGGVFIVES